VPKKRRLKPSAAQTLNHNDSRDHNEGVLHQGLPLFTPLGLIDRKKDEADSGNPDHNA